MIHSRFQPWIFTRLFYFRMSFTALFTRAFGSLPSVGHFLVPWNLTQPALPPWAAEQVDLMYLSCTCMNLHEFISCPGPCRGHTGLFFLFVILFESSSDGFAAWFYPFLCIDLAGWWRSLGCLVYLFWWFTSPCMWNISLAVSRSSQNSVSPWVVESNPWMISCFFHSFGNENSNRSRILSSGKPCPDPKGGDLSRYYTIVSIQKMKSLIFVSWGLYNPLRRYLFWRWSAFDRNKL